MPIHCGQRVASEMNAAKLTNIAQKSGKSIRKLAGNIKTTIYTADLLLAGLSSIVYVCLRFIFHEMIKAAGFKDGGLINYDSYYHFAFVEELVRSGNDFLFQNPFGSLDQEPLLFNLYASVLKFFRPLYENNLFVFDCTIGALAIFMTSLCLLKLVSDLGLIEKSILLFGGGVAFIGVFLGRVPMENAVWAGYWGLTYLLNQIATPEIIYHFIFFFGLYCLIKGKDIGVVFVIVILMFLHPFTAMTFNVSVGSAWLYQWFKTHKMINHRLRLFIYAVASAIISVLLYQIYLPSISKDAEYYKIAYENIPFYIDTLEYVLFLIIPVSYCIGSLVFRKKTQYLDQPEKLWIFLGTSIFCIAMSTSYLFTDKIIQPAHWSRVFPYIFILAAGGLFVKKRNGIKASKISKFVKVCLLCIAIFDSALGIKYVSKALLTEKRPPLFLTTDQVQVIEKAKNLTPGMFLYLRDSANKQSLGDFEYAMMALSPQKGFFGHTHFSPFFKSIGRYLYPCRQGYRLPHQWLNLSDYIVFDRNLFEKFIFQHWSILYMGKELVFVRNIKDT